MSKLIRKLLTWVLGVAIAILVAIGLTTISYFARQVDVILVQDIICLGSNYSSSDSDFPPSSQKLYGWPFHFRTVTSHDLWEQCYDYSSNALEDTDDFIVRNFALNIAIYTIPAIGMLLLLKWLQQPRRRE